jgi:DNA-binding response OmpR family regulator
MTKARVLIVEDEAIIGMAMRVRLKRMDYDVPAVARTGEEAVGLAMQHRPDLILMDIRLAGRMDGVEAAVQIRRDADIPIVFLTAYSDDDTRARAKATGAVGYMTKPFGDRELTAALELGLRRRGAGPGERMAAR